MMLTCTQCGWVHMGRTLAEVTAEVKRFNEFYEALDASARDRYYNNRGPLSVDEYRNCTSCGVSNTYMREAREGDIPGDRCVTVQPILDPVWN